jgi:hypothetical protein
MAGAPATGGAGGAAGTVFEGDFLATQYPPSQDGATGARYDASATFITITGTLQIPGCVAHAVSAACVSSVCTDPIGTPTGATVTKVSAGSVTMTGGSKMLQLDASPTPKTIVTAGEGVLFAGGEMLTVSSTGADVPAFVATVVAPDAPVVTAPVAPAVGAMLTIDRTVGLDVAWTGATTATVQIQLSVADTAGKTGLVICRFDGALGAATLAPSDLADLPPGPGQLSVSADKRVKVVAGAYAVDVTANAYARAPEGFAYRPLATVK